MDRKQDVHPDRKFFEDLIEIDLKNPRTLEEIDEERVRVLAKKADIDADLASIRTQLSNMNGSTPREREVKAMNALRFKGGVSQRLQARLGQLSFERKAAVRLEQEDSLKILRQVARLAYAYFERDGGEQGKPKVRELLEEKFDELDKASPNWREGVR